jgi:hypothetical protein
MREVIVKRENLQINEGYGFELEGVYCVATGGHAFQNTKALLEHFPTFTFVKEIHGFEIDSIQVNSRHMEGLYFTSIPESLNKKFTYDIWPEIQPPVTAKYSSPELIVKVRYQNNEQFLGSDFYEYVDSGIENVKWKRRPGAEKYFGFIKIGNEINIDVSFSDVKKIWLESHEESVNPTIEFNLDEITDVYLSQLSSIIID